MNRKKLYRIAIISDIHGNLEALKTVFKHIKLQNVDQIFCLGDLVGKGINLHECIELVRPNCQIVLQGNTDKVFGCKTDLSQYSELSRKRIALNKERMTEDDMNFLCNLPMTYEFYMSGSLIRAFHATPTSLTDVVNVWDSPSRKYELFVSPQKNGQDADVVVYGHLHTQSIEKLYNKTMINVGSVGNSLDHIRNEEKDSSATNTTQAFYVILEGVFGEKERISPFNIIACRVPYDIDKELTTYNVELDKEIYFNELKFGKYRDKTKANRTLADRGVDISKI